MTVAIITAVAGLVTAVAALVRSIKGESDHKVNAARISNLEKKG